MSMSIYSSIATTTATGSTELSSGINKMHFTRDQVQKLINLHLNTYKCHEMKCAKEREYLKAAITKMAHAFYEIFKLYERQRKDLVTIYDTYKRFCDEFGHPLRIGRPEETDARKLQNIANMVKHFVVNLGHNESFDQKPNVIHTPTQAAASNIENITRNDNLKSTASSSSIIPLQKRTSDGDGLDIKNRKRKTKETHEFTTDSSLKRKSVGDSLLSIHGYQGSPMASKDLSHSHMTTAFSKSNPNCSQNNKKCHLKKNTPEPVLKCERAICLDKIHLYQGQLGLNGTAKLHEAYHSRRVCKMTQNSSTHPNDCNNPSIMCAENGITDQLRINGETQKQQLKTINPGESTRNKCPNLAARMSNGVINAAAGGTVIVSEGRDLSLEIMNGPKNHINGLIRNDPFVIQID